MLLIMSAMLSTCQTTGFVATDISCDAFRPISWSKSDTFDTALQIREHNAAWRSLCEPLTSTK